MRAYTEAMALNFTKNGIPEPAQPQTQERQPSLSRRPPPLS